MQVTSKWSLCRAARPAARVCAGALGIAGAIIAELPDAWQAELVPLLKEEFGGEAESVEERVVTASLRAVPAKLRSDVEAMFMLFAIFAEDAVVPDTAIDVVAPLMKAVGSAAGGGAALRWCFLCSLKA